MGYPFENIGIGQENQKQNRYRMRKSGGRIGIGSEYREAESVWDKNIGGYNRYRRRKSGGRIGNKIGSPDFE